MNKTQQNIMRGLAIRSFLELLGYVSFCLVFSLFMFFIADVQSDIISILLKIDFVVFVGTILYWIVFRRTLMKTVLNERMRILSEKAQQKNEIALTIFMEDLGDVAADSWNLALGRPRGNYKERCVTRDEKLSKLYEETVRYANEEAVLATVLEQCFIKKHTL